jgi:hypothetical protein
MTTAKYSLSIEVVDVGELPDDSTVIDYSDFEKGMVFVPAGAGFTELAFHASTSADGVYLATLVAIMGVSAGNAYAIPSELTGARFLKITGDATGVVGVTLKD